MNDDPASGDPQRAGRPERSPAAADVAGTLSDLERKLRELEIELSSVRRPAGRQPAAAPSPPPPLPPPAEPDPEPPHVPDEPPPAPEPEARLVDEGLAPPDPPPPPAAGPSTGPPRQPSPPEPPPPVGEFARSPAAPPPPPSAPPTELVAEVRERIAGVEAQLEDLMRLRREIELRAHALETGAAPATAATAPPPPPSIHTQPPRTPPEPAEAMFEGPVVLEVGPLPDIAAVAELELKLTRLAQVISAHVRSYAGQRAVVDLQLAAPTPLPRHLRDALGAQLSVLDSASDRLSVVVETGAGLAPRL